MQIRSEALPYVLPPAVVAAAAAAVGAPLVMLTAILIAVAMGSFFRDPQRSADALPNAVLAPADGRILDVQSNDRELEITIFLAIWNVHVTRSPVSGQLLTSERFSGGYEAAYKPAASNNARCAVSIESPFGPVLVTMISGAVARRIHTWVGPGDRLERGQRIGLIRFGSRTEIVLPAGSEPQVSIGEHVRAGETIIANAPPQDSEA
jgi:phosphatidylserine decarboxylase